MSTAPMTVGPDDDLREAIEIMIDEKIGGIPVVEEEKGLVGIVTYVDVLRCFFEQLEGASLTLTEENYPWRSKTIWRLKKS
jgi:CBS domain-containing protein